MGLAGLSNRYLVLYVWTLHLDYLTTTTPYLPVLDFPIPHEIILAIPRLSNRNPNPYKPDHTTQDEEDGRKSNRRARIGSIPNNRLTPIPGPSDAIIPGADKDDAGMEVIPLLLAGEVAVVLMMVPVPGKGAMDGAEKLPNPLGTPVLLGILSVSSSRGCGIVHIRWYSPSSNGPISKAGVFGASPWQIRSHVMPVMARNRPISIASVNADPSKPGLTLSLTLNLIFFPVGTFTL
jgi:hypothetical protein